MASGLSNIYNLAYDGTGFPQINSKVITGLTRGEVYDFKVSAMNFNGEGPLSTAALRTYSCVQPSNVPAPTRLQSLSTESTITLSW
jgi:hypothetical protein